MEKGVYNLAREMLKRVNQENYFIMSMEEFKKIFDIQDDKKAQKVAMKYLKEIGDWELKTEDSNGDFMHESVSGGYIRVNEKMIEMRINKECLEEILHLMLLDDTYRTPNEYVCVNWDFF